MATPIMAEVMGGKRISSPAECGLLVSLGIFPFIIMRMSNMEANLAGRISLRGYIGFCPISRARSFGQESWCSPCNKTFILLPSVGNMLVCVAWRCSASAMEVHLARRARVLGESREDVSCLMEETQLICLPWTWSINILSMLSLHRQCCGGYGDRPRL